MNVTRIFGLIFVLCLVADARNVDLSTVPRRDTVALTIYNSEDITLVRETRAVTFKKGVNPLQFSLANTLIDPTSVQLRFLSQPEKLDVLDTTFPHDKPHMLYWNVQSEIDGEATIEITYFTSGITWSADYIAVADKDETQLAIESFVRVHNNSGEQYENAQVRLVVGTINLVEKIAQLARVTEEEFAQMDAAKKLETRTIVTRRVVKELADRQEKSAAEAPAEPKAVIKEGLSEYFIYTIEGAETIPNGWSKRLRSFEAKGAAFKIQYRYRPAEYGNELVRMYLLANNAEAKLGTTPLPNGTVRLFRENGLGGLSFLTQREIKYIPIGDKIELNLGPDPNVIFELVKLRASRDELWLQVHGTDVFRQVGGGVQVEVNSSVVGWNDRSLYTQRIRNYTAKPIEVEVRHTFPGHVIFRSPLDAVLHDYQTVQFTATVAPAKKADLLFEIVRQQGRNAKHNNVTLEKGQVR